MGRYYNGDIEGKFWFGVQSSNDADFFGVNGYQPERLEYYFDTSNLQDIKEGITKCKKQLGSYEKKIDSFFKKGGAGHEGYNDEIITKAGLNAKEFNSKLEWYARLHLGKKILKAVKENGSCEFEAEL